MRAKGNFFSGRSLLILNIYCDEKTIGGDAGI